MRFIAHRGNFEGPSEHENDPKYIVEALGRGFDVEIDVWRVKGKFFLGHDKPKYEVDISLLNQWGARLWLHCKNFEVLCYFAGPHYHYFWHETDKYTLTSDGLIWTYPRNPARYTNSVLVVEDGDDWKRYISGATYAICGDDASILEDL